jgi:hypothetical protein
VTQPIRSNAQGCSKEGAATFRFSADDRRENRQEHEAMNTWMQRMQSWSRTLAISVRSMWQKPAAQERNYWDRQSRTWSDARQLAYAVRRAEPVVTVRRRTR